MDHFNYRDGSLFGEDVRLDEIADAVGTPCYVYSRRTLIDHATRLAEAFAPIDPLICFSIKSCSNISVLRELAALGAGMDLVSGGELFRAQAAGVDPERCVYAGVGKTNNEIREALRAGVGWFNVESEAEFENLAALSKEEGVTARCALRVNPDVDPRTHKYTTTGKRETKFGVDLERARRFFEQYGHETACRLEGLHVHIGSPVYAIDPYERTLEKILALIDELAGRGFTVRMLDLGGGFGADYESGQSPDARAYAATIVPMLQAHVDRGLKVVLEPGRSIAANAGVLLTEVQYVKESGTRTFVICDAGMHTLLRPSHYEAFHFMWPTTPRDGLVPPRRAKELDLPGLAPVDVVGPICETGDFLALDRPLPPMVRGDRLAVFSAGAYGMSMASRYNSMPLPAEVMVDGDAWRVIRRREQYEDLIAHEEGAAVAAT